MVHILARMIDSETHLHDVHSDPRGMCRRVSKRHPFEFRAQGLGLDTGAESGSDGPGTAKEH
jgi:hypothetical protein